MPRIGWTVMVLLTVVFVWGLHRRSVLEVRGDRAITMLFVPSVEQGTLVRRGDELARFIRADSGLTLKSQVPTSYAAVIQALGADQADVAWIPAFAYVLANARYGAEARLQVVRSVDRYGIVGIVICFSPPRQAYHRLRSFGGGRSTDRHLETDQQLRPDLDGARNPGQGPLCRAPAQTPHKGPNSLRPPQRDLITRSVSLPAGPDPA